MYTKVGSLLFFIRLIIFIGLIILMYLGFKFAGYILITLTAFSVFVANEAAIHRKRVKEFNEETNYQDVIFDKMKNKEKS